MAGGAGSQAAGLSNFVLVPRMPAGTCKAHLHIGRSSGRSSVSTAVAHCRRHDHHQSASIPHRAPFAAACLSQLMQGRREGPRGPRGQSCCLLVPPQYFFVLPAAFKECQPGIRLPVPADPSPTHYVTMAAPHNPADWSLVIPTIRSLGFLEQWWVSSALGVWYSRGRWTGALGLLDRDQACCTPSKLPPWPPWPLPNPYGT